MVIFYTAFNQVILNLRIRFFNPLLAFSWQQKNHFALSRDTSGRYLVCAYPGTDK